MSTADRIKQLRLQKGWTQEQLGTKIGVQKAAIAKYESGRVENLKRDTIEKMSMLFNVSPAYLLCIDSDSDSQYGFIQPNSDVDIISGDFINLSKLDKENQQILYKYINDPKSLSNEDIDLLSKCINQAFNLFRDIKHSNNQNDEK